ncbi:hypothetical protein EGH21_21145 [Halomicroarcula sp. F13]|uniref:Uncharacterized protein n=1 Tax=Haloarcula rubra TaxID=2487747 RepID=A0AAW4PYC3_9EURY|nr:hypothetical protein [Halomicroarcula rubra]MBX0325535.1 hypothetical protein [Halomicroarcula rubra]
MSTKTSDSTDRLPTAGPDTGTFDRYKAVITDDGEFLIYDVESEDAWIQSQVAVKLETYR